MVVYDNRNNDEREYGDIILWTMQKTIIIRGKPYDFKIHNTCYLVMSISFFVSCSLSVLLSVRSFFLSPLFVFLYFANSYHFSLLKNTCVIFLILARKDQSPRSFDRDISYFNKESEYNGLHNLSEKYSSLSVDLLSFFLVWFPTKSDNAMKSHDHIIMMLSPLLFLFFLQSPSPSLFKHTDIERE